MFAKCHEVVLVDRQQHWLHTHGSVTQQGKHPSAVDEEVLGETLRTDTFEDDVVRLQSLEVNSTGKSRVETLSQTLTYCHLFGDNLVLQMRKQNLLYKKRKNNELVNTWIFIVIP